MSETNVGLVMFFDAMLMSCKDGSFTSTEGSNKGQEYKWTELEFNNSQVGTFILRTVAPISVDVNSLRKELHWELGIEAKMRNNKTQFKVLSVSGGKVKV
jgi:hypothetical protein